MQITTHNPATGEILETYTQISSDEAVAIAKEVALAQKKWGKVSVANRAQYFLQLATVLKKNRDVYATTITKEMGKPIKESRAEVEKCAWLAEYLAEHGGEWLKEKEVVADGKKHVIVYDPLGVILLVMPWNYPFWQAMKVGLPPLLAGNAMLLKHASNVSGCSLAIQDAFREAGFPDNVFRSMIMDHTHIPHLFASNFVHAGSLTGSERAGASFAESAGKHVKKVVLELGGSDPFIVFPDADVTLAAKGAVKGRFSNGGQVCIAAKRIFVHQSIVDAFTKIFVQEVEALRVGDPMDETTDIGPLVHDKAVQDMEAFVANAVEQGAQLRTGGKRHALGKTYFEPTVFGQATTHMAMVSQEVFGPIAPIVSFDSEEEVIAWANESVYGLSASVWTKDVAFGEHIARQLETGSVFINSPSKSDPRLPIGGIKRSGFGRELSEFGIREFVNVKTVNVYE